jgi:hypothetical protein
MPPESPRQRIIAAPGRRQNHIVGIDDMRVTEIVLFLEVAFDERNSIVQRLRSEERLVPLLDGLRCTDAHVTEQKIDGTTAIVRATYQPSAD